MRRRMMLVVAASLASSLALAPHKAAAEGLFDMFFGVLQKQERQTPPQTSFFAALPKNGSDSPRRKRVFSPTRSARTSRLRRGLSPQAADPPSACAAAT